MPARGGVKYRIRSTASGEHKSAMDGDDIDNINDDNNTKMLSTSHDPALSATSTKHEKQSQATFPIHYMSTSSMPSRATPKVSSPNSIYHSSNNKMSWDPPEANTHQSLTSSRPPRKASVAPAPVTPSPAANRKTIPLSPSAASPTYSRTGSRSNHRNGPWKDGDAEEAWRRYGKLFRANLVLNDEQNGGNSFSLSDSCTIERYYRVADRVRCCGRLWINAQSSGRS
jgi:hypothetical protein